MEMTVRTPAPIMWTCGVAALFGVLLTVLLPSYRNALGVVTTGADWIVRSGPGLACATAHLGCGLRSRRARIDGDRASLLCGIFDVTVAVLSCIPWAGLWIALFSPFSFVFYVASSLPARAMGAAYAIVTVATGVAGAMMAVRSSRPRWPRWK